MTVWILYVHRIAVTVLTAVLVELEFDPVLPGGIDAAGFTIPVSFMTLRPTCRAST